MLDSRKEDFQYAYLAALCSEADIDLEQIRHDDDSTDAIIKCIVDLDTYSFRSSIRLQLKCTASSKICRISGDDIAYDLPVKNYNDLRLQGEPFLLMLLVLPEEEDPLIWTEDELLMKGSMYYKNLIGMEETSNINTVAVHFSRSEDIVNQEVLHELLRKAAMGEL